MGIRLPDATDPSVVIDLPALANANDINIVIGKDGTVFHYQFNLYNLITTISQVVYDIEGPVINMPTHEQIAKDLKRGLGCA